MDTVVMLDASSPVTAAIAEDRIVRVKFGLEPYGVTLLGDLSDLHRLIIEADRQVSGLVNDGRIKRPSQRS